MSWVIMMMIPVLLSLRVADRGKFMQLATNDRIHRQENGSSMGMTSGFGRERACHANPSLLPRPLSS